MCLPLSCAISELGRRNFLVRIQSVIGESYCALANANHFKWPLELSFIATHNAHIIPSTTAASRSRHFWAQASICSGHVQHCIHNFSGASSKYGTRSNLNRIDIDGDADVDAVINFETFANTGRIPNKRSHTNSRCKHWLIQKKKKWNCALASQGTSITAVCIDLPNIKWIESLYMNQFSQPAAVRMRAPRRSSTNSK